MYCTHVLYSVHFPSSSINFLYKHINVIILFDPSNSVLFFLVYSYNKKTELQTNI